MALWKAREGEVHKSQILDSSFKKQELDFRPWHCGRQAEGSLNKVFDFGSWHCGRQGRKCKSARTEGAGA